MKTKIEVGMCVKAKRDLIIYNGTFKSTDNTAKVVSVGKDEIVVKFDKHFEDLEEWDNHYMITREDYESCVEHGDGWLEEKEIESFNEYFQFYFEVI